MIYSSRIIGGFKKEKDFWITTRFALVTTEVGSSSLQANAKQSKNEMHRSLADGFEPSRAVRSELQPGRRLRHILKNMQLKINIYIMIRG